MRHLVLYSVGYVLWCSLVGRRSDRPRRALPLPGDGAIVWFVAGLALATWLVRGWYPIDEWVPLLFVAVR